MNTAQYNHLFSFIWNIANRKEARRKGKVQLIDATSIKTPLRKNLGEKNCETNEADRKKILDLLMAFEENEYSKIFPNEEFGYWEVELFKPAKDENGNAIKDKKGRVKMAKVKGEVEQIPFPPIEEQKKIVAFLDKQITLIKSCKCQRKRELQTLNELKQAEIASVVTGQINVQNEQV